MKKSVMRDGVEGFEEVKDGYVCLAVTVKVLSEVFMVTASWVSQEKPDLKPWFRDVRVLFSSKWRSILEHTICSRTFDNTQVKEIGR